MKKLLLAASIVSAALICSAFAIDAPRPPAPSVNIQRPNMPAVSVPHQTISAPHPNVQPSQAHGVAHQRWGGTEERQLQAQRQHERQVEKEAKELVKRQQLQNAIRTAKEGRLAKQKELEAERRKLEAALAAQRDNKNDNRPKRGSPIIGSNPTGSTSPPPPPPPAPASNGATNPASGAGNPVFQGGLR
jgi:TolA-binding protein